ncbi:hypothetical protein P0136_05385 [Lentisphaerota bacterium ZTH]|nr:hypothetical protein JYG24_03500 [Lentisphaerota bacterium]WET07424.1 hypothetical protein P0136_05385 [Lentisphaerota bacterium ZTH]
MKYFRNLLLYPALFLCFGVSAAEVQDYREQTSFHAVTSQLDPGGTLFFYISSETFIKAVENHYELLKKVIARDLNLAPSDRENAFQILRFVRNVCRNSGFGVVDGAGVSAIKISKDLYRTRMYVHRAKEKQNGILWKVMGMKPEKLKLLQSLPADTIYCDGLIFKPFLFWKWLKDQNADAKSIVVGARLRKVEEFFTARQVNMNRFLQCFEGDIGFVITADVKKRMNLPLLAGGEIQQLDFALYAKVKDSYAFDAMGKLVPQFAGKSGNAGVINLGLPPLLPHLKPVVVLRNNYLFIATNEYTVDKIVKTMQGKGPRLVDQPEYKALLQGLPLDGNGFEFFSRRLVTIFGDIFRRAMAHRMAGNLINDLEKSFSLDYLAVWQITDHGVLMTMNSNMDPAALLIFKTMIMPAGFNVGMLMPTLLKEHGRRRSIKQVSNLREAGMALKMYAMSHNDCFPEASGSQGLAELTSGKKKYIDADKLLDADGRQFCYIGGFKETSSKNIPLAFERPDAESKQIRVLFIDGRVEVLHSETPISTVSGVIVVLNKLYKYPEETLRKLMSAAAAMDKVKE